MAFAAIGGTAANALAKRLIDATKAEQIERAYRITLGRFPTENEKKRASEFLADSPLSELCRALLNLNEFVYVD